MESEKYSIVPVYIIIKYLHIQTFTFYSNIYVASSLDTIWKMATVNTLQEKRIPREEDSRFPEPVSSGVSDTAMVRFMKMSLAGCY